MKIQRLNEIATRFNERTEVTETTLGYANKGHQRALNDLNTEVGKKKGRIYGKKNMIDESSMTRFHGLNKKLDDLVGGGYKDDVPKIDKMIQAFPFKDSALVQTIEPWP